MRGTFAMVFFKHSLYLSPVFHCLNNLFAPFDVVIFCDIGPLKHRINNVKSYKKLIIFV